jgi:hypothetical protein
MRRALLSSIAAALMLAACGGHHKPGGHKLAATSGPCPVGHAHMGCANAPPSLLVPHALKFTSGPRFPDVSNWQGHPNWSAAKPYIVGAAIKAGEATFRDSDFAWNVSQLTKLSIPWVAYWFVRPIDCASQAVAIVGALRAVGGPDLKRIVYDIEVPGLAGYAACLDKLVAPALGVHGVIYTSPGTWSGGDTAGLDLWVASYGNVLPCLFTCNVAVAGKQSIIAWQNTDGQYGQIYNIPGLGKTDVSINYGLVSRAAPAPPPTQTCTSSLSASYNCGFNTGWTGGVRWGLAH